MNLRRFVRLLAISSGMLLFSGIASADAGVPMLFITLPAMLMALIPIIALETFIVGRTLGARVFSNLKAVAIANLASTIIGIPITWIVLVILQLVSGGGAGYGLDTPARKLMAVTWQAPWLIPYESDLYWMLPAASLTLLLPFFFTSYFVERLVVVRIERGYTREQLSAAVFRANLISYMLLAVFTVGWLLWSLQRGPLEG